MVRKAVAASKLLSGKGRCSAEPWIALEACGGVGAADVSKHPGELEHVAVDDADPGEHHPPSLYPNVGSHQCPVIRRGARRSGAPGWCG